MGALLYILFSLSFIADIALGTDTDKECYYEPTTSYSGTLNKTWSGYTCQRWDVQTPHVHIYDISYFPMEETLYDVHNYCRDPKAEGYLWCFTLGSDLIWESCDIQVCTARPTPNNFLPGSWTFPNQPDTDTECYHEPTTSYSGTRSKTWSGYTCQRWDVQTPHVHNYDISYFPMEETLYDVHNYCRDPKAEGYLWCFTIGSDVISDSCYVPVCTARTTMNNFLPDSDTECYHEPTTSYSGTRNKTWSGHTCQRWDVQTPHVHNYGNNEFPMEDTLYDVHNYCRDPLAEGYLWCFTTDPGLQWESCGIPMCAAGTTPNSHLPDLSFASISTTQSDVLNMTTEWQSNTRYQTSSSNADQDSTDETTLPTVTQGANKIFTPFPIILVQYLYSLSPYL